ncbi:glutenin, high molecular weight subunit DY10 [Diachasma alloeum]|uniref:glutenin, high molecular weight subunit DY10 n=1 Tax=Diachasma alloeum TaxID=454923 RepID=UPI0007382853|nr:glutenin, high molecular weight subunit DY10 [Diachasma alloeum]
MFQLLMIVVVGSCASQPVDKVQQVGGQPGQIVQGQGHVSQGGIQKPDQSYVAVGNGQYPGNGYQGQGSVNVVQGVQEQHPVNGVQGQGHLSQGDIQTPDQSYVAVGNGQYPGNGYQGQGSVNVVQGVQEQHPVNGVQGQGHLSQGDIQTPDQSYVAVGNGQYPGNGFHGLGSVNVAQGLQEQHPVHGVQGQGHVSQGGIQKPDQSYVTVSNGQYRGNGYQGLRTVNVVQGVQGQHPVHGVQGQGHFSQGDIQKPDQSYVTVSGQHPGNGYQGQGSVNVVQGVQEQHPVHGVQGQGHLSQGDIQKPDQSYVAVGNGQYPGNGFHGLGSVNVAQGVQEQHPVHGVQEQGHVSQGGIQKPDQSYVTVSNGQYRGNGYQGLRTVNVAQGVQGQHPVHGVQGQGHVSQGGIQKPDQSYVPVSGQYPGNGYQGQGSVNVAQGVQEQHPVHGVQGQGHVSQGGIQKPDQSYVPVSGQYPGNGYQGQGSVNVAQGVQEQHPVHGVQGQVEHGQVVPVGIISQDSEVNPDGTFHNVWESENGIKVQEEASVKLLDDNTVSQTVTGQISYVDNEGKQVLLRYVADETGFHPEGDHLPTPPPLPTGIARGLEWIRAHPPAEETKLHEETVLNEKHFAQERTGGY